MILAGENANSADFFAGCGGVVEGSVPQIRIFCGNHVRISRTPDTRHHESWGPTRSHLSPRRGYPDSPDTGSAQDSHCNAFLIWPN